MTVLVLTALIAAAPAPATAPPTWAEFEKEHRLVCQTSFDARVQPVERAIGDSVYRIEGSRVLRRGPASKQVTLGVLSAIKDVEEETKANLKRAAEAFRAAGVDAVIANGDIALNQFDLEEVMIQLGEMGLPVFVLIGNSEGRGGFNRAFLAAEQKHPNLFNLNWVRHVDLGPVHLVSQPGYHDRAFMPQSSGCRYRSRDVRALDSFVGRLRSRGANVVLVGHGPPASKGKAAIDRAHEAGNVGDPELATLIADRDVRFGIFGHILEAGGRASSDLRLGQQVRPGRRSKKLYVNAGSASSVPWGMLDGRSSTGMAMLVEIDRGGASYKVVKLSSGNR